MDQFYIGQIFEDDYPPEAAVWCNQNNAHIENVDGVRTIVENKKPIPTKTVRIFSKYKLCDTTSQIPFLLADGTKTTVWEAFKSFLAAAGKKDLWDNIIEIAEDNPHFLAALPIAIENFGSDLVEQVLAASVERTITITQGE